MGGEVMTYGKFRDLERKLPQGANRLGPAAEHSSPSADEASREGGSLSLPPPVPGTHFGYARSASPNMAEGHIDHRYAVIAYDGYQRGVRETRLAYGRIG